MIGEPRKTDNGNYDMEHAKRWLLQRVMIAIPLLIGGGGLAGILGVDMFSQKDVDHAVDDAVLQTRISQRFNNLEQKVEFLEHSMMSEHKELKADVRDVLLAVERLDERTGGDN